MTPEQFCYWLQGLLEVGVPDNTALQPAQVKAIKEHLATVFHKTTPEVKLEPLTPPITPFPYVPPTPDPVWVKPDNPLWGKLTITCSSRGGLSDSLLC